MGHIKSEDVAARSTTSSSTRVRATALIGLTAALTLCGGGIAAAAPQPYEQQNVTAVVGADDPFTQILREVARTVGASGSAVPLPPCTPGTVTNIGCEPN
ncbi:hypothetical protein GCM10027088_50990 [Nocardia goodfellowii]|uniref:Methylmalonyl-CoA mutase cobalamin-binding subunit n=1 Tax=Nocardia goodfellowii TaxID=882446 RepID=A0ABS4QR18_9NOCA|nr:methylmalonyl-CoA mutase cobalamin-binding subunit [Nocardia goodfellowii]